MDFQLHIITDGQKSLHTLSDIIDQSARAGADVVQLRYKTSPALDMFHMAQELSPIVQQYGTQLIINDRVDVMQAVQAHGAHLGEKSIPLQVVRSFVGTHFQLGMSVHSVDAAIQAERDGASYITFGHIFPTASKPGLQPRGVRVLEKVVHSVSIPVIAIGGIDITNLDQVLATGCHGVAVIRAVMDHPNPYQATVLLKEKMDQSPYRPKVYKERERYE